MTRKYTAADFVNARFAEHPDGGLATRSGEGYYTWEVAGVPLATDGIMARKGWVPVPTKPTITQSLFDDIAESLMNGHLALEDFMDELGVEVIPDPEPTNTERLVDWIAEAIHESGRFSVDFKEVKFIAKYLDKHGVKVEGK